MTPWCPRRSRCEGPAGDAARQAASELSYVRKNHFVRPEDQDAVGVQLGARYDGSPIIVADGAPPPDVFPETYDEYTPSGASRRPRAACSGSTPSACMGSSLFDRFGKGFTLLRFNPPFRAEALERCRGAAEHSGPRPRCRSARAARDL